jgi:hypothetical protein
LLANWNGQTFGRLNHATAHGPGDAGSKTAIFVFLSSRIHARM